MKIINKYLIILLLYIICLILYIIRILLYQTYIKNTNIKIKKLTNKITVYNYNKNNKTIVIINGGGLLFYDITDIVIINNILKKINNYNIVVIKYDLFNKISHTIYEVTNTFRLLLTYNFNIKVFIGNSIGCTILLELFNIYKQFTKKKINTNFTCN
jgi:hypothetical protein